MRWLIALISDTSVRLAEAAGAAVSELVLDNKLPHGIVQLHDWRSLKTASSQCKIPLLGISLWTTRRIVANVK